jgi:hypothetical protein
MVRLMGLISVVVLMLVGCSPSETWNQRLTLVIETPQGEVRGSVVQRIEWEGTGALLKAMTSAVDSSSANVRATGEAVAVEVMPGRWLFALLKGGSGWQGEPGLNAGFAIAVPRGHFAKSAEGVRDIVMFPRDTPIELPPEAWPMLVTFDDITKPETVRRVNPDDLAAVFGEGVRLKAVTLEITEEAVTEGRVEGVLPWLEKVGREQANLIGRPASGLVSNQADPGIYMITPLNFSTELFE